MKKLIAIAVMIALVAGAVFADSSISGGVDVRFGVFAPGGSGNDPFITGGPAEGQIQWSGRNDEESFGGTYRIRFQDSGVILERPSWMTDPDKPEDHPVVMDDPTGPNPNVIEAWWKPIDQLRIYLGQNGDALFESVNMNHWGYNQGAEGWVTTHDWKYWRTLFPGAEDKFVLAFNFYLVDGLDLNLIYGIGGNGNRSSNLAKDFIGNIHLNMGYTIEGVGKILFDWIGSSAENWTDSKLYGTLGFSFYSGDLVDGLSFHVGFAKFLASSDAVKALPSWGGGNPDGVTPTYIGLGVAYLGGEWGVKFRAGMTLGGIPGGYAFFNGFNSTGTGIDGNTHMVFTVMPWYDMGNMKINLDFGFIMNSPKVGDSTNGFWINPYLTVPGGPGKFQIGIKAYKNVDAMNNWDWMGQIPGKDGDVNISIPMRLVFSF